MSSCRPSILASRQFLPPSTETSTRAILPRPDHASPDHAHQDQASPDQQPTLQPQTRLAYTALAGVLVTSLAATHVEAVPGRNLGEYAD